MLVSMICTEIAHTAFSLFWPLSLRLTFSLLVSSLSSLLPPSIRSFFCSFLPSVYVAYVYIYVCRYEPQPVSMLVNISNGHWFLFSHFFPWYRSFLWTWGSSPHSTLPHIPAHTKVVRPAFSPILLLPTDPWHWNFKSIKHIQFLYGRCRFNTDPYAFTASTLP